nr:unnamed protein product [Callosobruchus analis]
MPATPQPLPPAPPLRGGGTVPHSLRSNSQS